MRNLCLGVLIGLLGGGGLGCAITPAEQEAARQAWAARDAERAQECERAQGQWAAGGCAFWGPN